jgi:uncharacterized cupin superfamily protein
VADVTVKSLDEFDTAFGGGLRRVRAGLGITAFGLQVIELPPNFGGYPEHDHSHDEQEEVYAPLSGQVTLQVGGADHILEPGSFARVGPGEKRKLITGEQGCRIICIGGVPGAAYEPPEYTEEGGGELKKVKA